MKVCCIVQARTTSSRFPMKIFAGIGGRPMLAHVLERAAAIHGVDQVVLAVPENDVRLVSHLWPHVYGGSENDVLSRYAGAAEKYEADVIARVTGDCPFLATDMASCAVGLFDELNGSYLAVCQPYTPVSDGWDVEIFSRNLLVHANKLARKDEREHVTTWMRLHAKVCGLPEWEDRTALKCSVDERSDLERVIKIYKQLENKKDFSHISTWNAWLRAGRP